MSLVKDTFIYIRTMNYKNTMDLVYDLVGQRAHIIYLISKKGTSTNEMLILTDLEKRTNTKYYVLEFDEQSPYEALKMIYQKIKRAMNITFKNKTTSKPYITINMTGADSYTFMIMLYVYLIFRDVAKLVVQSEHNYIFLPPIEIILKPQKLAILRLLFRKENHTATYNEIRKELVSMFHNRKYSISSISKHVSKLESCGFVKTYSTIVKIKNKHGKSKNVRILNVILTESGKMALFVAEKAYNKSLENV